MARMSNLARYEMMRRARNEANGNMDGGNMEMRQRMEQHYDREDEDYGTDPLEQRRYMPRRKDGTFRPRNEMYANYRGEREDAIEPNEREGRGHIIGFTDRMRGGGGENKMTPEMAKKWVQKMRCEDGSPGEHWNMEQVKHLMAERGVKHDPAEVYAIMNALYSDYCKVFKKYGLTTPEAVLDMAVAWIEDSDAVQDKVMAYYECIVKK